MSIDIDAIKKRDDTEYGMECNTDGIGTTLQYALTDRNDLLREVARLRGEVERERAAVVAWLREVSERRFPRNEREQGIVFRLAHEIERGEHRREEEK